MRSPTGSGCSTAIPRPQHFLRDYGIGAQILVDLGVRDMVLLSNTRRTVVGLEGYGLNIVDQRPIDGAPTNRRMSTAGRAAAAAPRVPGPPPHLLLVRAPYYRDVVDGMTDGAARILREAGATHDVLDVAGAFELPQAIRIALRGSKRFDGFVALGCVVRGETDHYEFLCREAMAGLMNVALQYGIALGSGLLTVHELGAGGRALVRRRPQQGRRGGRGRAAADRRRAPAGRGLMARRPKPRPAAHRRPRRRRAGAVPERAGQRERRDGDRPVRPPPARRARAATAASRKAACRTRMCRCSPASSAPRAASRTGSTACSPGAAGGLADGPARPGAARPAARRRRRADRWRTARPPRVVINEYLDVAHGFFTGEEPRMVNGLLDRLARELRPGDFAAARPVHERERRAADEFRLHRPAFPAARRPRRARSAGRCRRCSPRRRAASWC